MPAEITLKKWGNSVGAVLPKEFVEAQGLKENDRVIIDIVKKADLTKIFGSLKGKMSGQEFKDMVRKGWQA
mgnify:CR=1 FL=1